MAFLFCAGRGACPPVSLGQYNSCEGSSQVQMSIADRGFLQHGCFDVDMFGISHLEMPNFLDMSDLLGPVQGCGAGFL